jgi:hypothetical protein
MFKCLSNDEVAMIRERFPIGSRVLITGYMDDPRPIMPGTKGTVRIVDDMGTVHCNFDNGRRLGLLPGIDSFTRLDEGVVNNA